MEREPKPQPFIIICHGAPTLAPKLCMNSFGMEVFFGSMEIYIINTVCIQIAYSQSRLVMRLGGDFLVFEANHLAIRPLNISCSIELPRAEVDLPRLRSRPRVGWLLRCAAHYRSFLVFLLCVKTMRSPSCELFFWRPSWTAFWYEPYCKVNLCPFVVAKVVTIDLVIVHFTSDCWHNDMGNRNNEIEFSAKLFRYLPK